MMNPCILKIPLTSFYPFYRFKCSLQHRLKLKDHVSQILDDI